MDWKDKKIIFLGDSITEGGAASSAENVYHQHVRRALGLNEAVNCGIGGTRFARQSAPSENPLYDLDFNARADQLETDTDLVVVFGGTNDFGHGDAPLGKKGDDTVYTFYGACKCLFEKLSKKYGKDRVVVITPMHRLDESNPYGDGNKKVIGIPLESYVNAVLETAKDEGLRLLNLWRDREFNPNIQGNEKYFVDGLHPTNSGHELLGKRVAQFLTRL